MPSDSVEVTEVVNVDLPEPLIYANADEFHVKSTVVYATGGRLFLDKALTKPVYSDKLERLFLAGGLKIAENGPDGDLFVYSPTSLTVGTAGATVVTAEGDIYSADIRPTEDSSDNSDFSIIMS